MILSIDLETRSPADLKRSGAYRYFEHPYTEILCAAWAIDDGPVSTWFPGDECPWAVGEAISGGAGISGWNVNFERQGFNHKLGPKHGWPLPEFGQYRDTAAQAAAQALPRALEKAARVLRMPEQKDVAGGKLMLQMAKPRKRRKGEEEKPVYWFEGDIGRLAAYCRQDVEVERAIRNKLQPLSATEMALWQFDQLINERGITLDLDLVEDMLAIVTDHTANLDRQLSTLTGGAVEHCSQTERLKDWLADRGVVTESLAKTVIEAVMARDMPAHCHRALALWQEASRASVRKLQAARLCVGGDSRARGLLLFHGATSGRWSGQLFQPQNLPRGEAGLVPDQDQAIAFMRHRSAELLDVCYGDPLATVSACLRGVMTAAPNRVLISGDYKNVESRITAWLAGDEAKLRQFVDQDNGGTEVYKLAASRIYNVPVSTIGDHDPRRQTGKTAELACLAAETRVLTDNGVKPITDVSINDRVWDGESWVGHQGVVSRGSRQTINLHGVQITADHLIWSGSVWKSAETVASNESLLRRALASGSKNLPSSATNMKAKAVAPTSTRSALAVPSHTASRFTTFAAALRHAAPFAQRSSRTIGEKIFSVTPILSLTTSIAAVCSIGFRLAKHGAYRAITSIMAGAAFAFSMSGVSARKGDAGFSPTLSRFQAGISQSWKWTGSIPTETTSQATCGSPPRAKASNDPSASCRPASTSLKPVYDIAHAGPLHRFTIISNSGALIVHNCGFGGGVDALAKMSRSYNINMEIAFPALWDAASPEEREMADKRFDDVLAKGNNDWLPRKAWQACWLVVRAWRRAHGPVVDMWDRFHSAAWHTLEESGKVIVAGKISFKRENGFLWLTLPSGRKLAYPTPAVENLEVPWSDKRLPKREREHRDMLTVLAFEQGRALRYPFYPGLTFQHAVQAIARDLLANGMEKVEAAGYPVVMSIHDEVLSEVRPEKADIGHFTSKLCELPDWAAGLPLLASGWAGFRYRK